MKSNIKIGVTHYFGGACKNGEAAPRRISDGHCTCKKCSSQKTERSRDRKRVAHMRDAEKNSARFKAWREGNAFAHASKKKAWKEANRDLHRAYNCRRRARKLNATPPWFGELDELVEREAVDLAVRRETVTGFPWELDHAIPLQGRHVCGLHIAANFQVIPARLNASKCNSMRFSAPLEWLKAI